MENGLVHIYTGDGKGKTSAALGLALRAAGRNLKVKIIQFLKSEDSGECLSLKKLYPDIELERFNSQKKFIWNMNEAELSILKKETLTGFERAVEITKNSECDVLILDEFIWCVIKNFVGMEKAKQFILTKPESMELVLTGRNAPDELIEISDYVTEMKKVKHPFEKGINAREGVEK